MTGAKRMETALARNQDMSDVTGDVIEQETDWIVFALHEYFRFYTGLLRRCRWFCGSGTPLGVFEVM
jgi:hypothetical protein